MNFKSLQFLEPYLDEVFQKFYDEMLSNRRFSIFFGDRESIELLISKQKANFIDSLSDSKEAFQERFKKLGVIHYNIQVPYIDFLKGSEFFRDRVVEISIRESFDIEIAKEIYDYTAQTQSLMSMGYIKSMIERDKFNIEHTLSTLEQDDSKRTLVLKKQLNWLYSILEAIEREDTLFEVNPDSCKFDDEFYNFIRDNRYSDIDRDYLEDLYQRVHIDANNIFYFLERGNYQDILPLYTSLLNIYKLSLTITNTISSNIYIKSLQRDIDRKNQNIDKLNKKFEFLTQITPDGIWDWNLLDNNLFVNRRLIQMLGYSKNFIKRVDDAFNLIHPDDIKNVEQKVKIHLNKESEFFESKMRFKCQDGSYKWIMGRGKAIFEDGKPVRILGFNTDIDREVREQLSLVQPQISIKL